MKASRFKALFYCLFAVLLSAGLLAAADIQVIIKSGPVSITGDKIYLGDVAEVSGAGQETTEEIKAVYIKRAAIPGYQVSVSRETVENKMRRYFPEAVVSGPEKISVTTGKGNIKGADVVETARRYLTDNMKWKPEDVTIQAKSFKSELPAGEGEVLLKVREDNSVKFKGNVVVPVEIYIDGKFYKIEAVSFLVNVTTEILTAAQDIKRHDIMIPAMVSKIRKDITFLPDDVIVDEARLNNCTSKRGIMAGAILLESMFERQPLFRRGDTVGVTVNIKTLSIETEGSAQEDGVEGKSVKVKLRTGKILEGKVNSSGKVIVER